MVRTLDFDDVGAEIGEALGEKGAGEHAAHVEYAQVFECFGHGEIVF